MQKVESVQINTMSSDESGIERQRIIQAVLKLQSTLVVSRESATCSEGFLISSFTPEELSTMIAEGRLVLAMMGDHTFRNNDMNEDDVASVTCRT